jgi:glycine/D-amino acid oxidase-like deaminating enzyme
MWAYEAEELLAMMKTTQNSDTIHPQSYDLVVIGAGPAGTCGANTAAIFGHRVALVEKEAQIGGAGINSGTVPSKTLRETALALSGWRSRKTFRRGPVIAPGGHHRRLYAPSRQRDCG